VQSLSISSLSGIYDNKDFDKGYYEKLIEIKPISNNITDTNARTSSSLSSSSSNLLYPYNHPSQIRSIYHTRQFDHWLLSIFHWLKSLFDMIEKDEFSHNLIKKTGSLSNNESESQANVQASSTFLSNIHPFLSNVMQDSKNLHNLTLSQLLYISLISYHFNRPSADLFLSHDWPTSITNSLYLSDVLSKNQQQIQEFTNKILSNNDIIYPFNLFNDTNDSIPLSMKNSSFSSIFEGNNYHFPFQNKQFLTDNSSSSSQNSRILSSFPSYYSPLHPFNISIFRRLLSSKSFFSDDISRADLGSPFSSYLLDLLKPRFWLSAHLHVKLASKIYHYLPHKYQSRADSIRIESNFDNNKSVVDESSSNSNTITKINAHSLSSTLFLALDKCLPKRKFLQMIDIKTQYEDSFASDNSSILSGKSDHSSISSIDPPMSFLPASNIDNSNSNTPISAVFLSYHPIWLAIIKSTYRYQEKMLHERPEMRFNTNTNTNTTSNFDTNATTDTNTHHPHDPSIISDFNNGHWLPILPFYPYVFHTKLSGKHDLFMKNYPFLLEKNDNISQGSKWPWPTFMPTISQFYDIIKNFPSLTIPQSNMATNDSNNSVSIDTESQSPYSSLHSLIKQLNNHIFLVPFDEDAVFFDSFEIMRQNNDFLQGKSYQTKINCRSKLAMDTPFYHPQTQKLLKSLSLAPINYPSLSQSNTNSHSYSNSNMNNQHSYNFKQYQHLLINQHHSLSYINNPQSQSVTSPPMKKIKSDQDIGTENDISNININTNNNQDQEIELDFI
jgi:hypothetical protein